MPKCHRNQWSLSMDNNGGPFLDSRGFYLFVCDFVWFFFVFHPWLLLLKLLILKIQINACKVLIRVVLADMKHPTHVLWVAHKCVKENLIAWLWSDDSHWLVVNKMGWWIQLLFLPHSSGCWIFPWKTPDIHLQRWIFALSSCSSIIDDSFRGALSWCAKILKYFALCIIMRGGSKVWAFSIMWK